MSILPTTEGEMPLLNNLQKLFRLWYIIRSAVRNVTITFNYLLRKVVNSMYKAKDIANYFLFKSQQEEQELLSNLKLQKLIYYSQGLHLALHGTALFNENIEAWNYGPVVPELYHLYKHYGKEGIIPDDKFVESSIDPKTREFLDEVYDVFGQYSAVRLMEISHNDKCWSEAGIGNIISHEAMKTDLKKYLKDEYK